MDKVTCKIVLDTKSKEPEKRLFLSVTHLRQAYKYSLGLDYKLTKEQFENKNLKVTKEALSAAEPEKLRAEQIISNLGKDFSFSKFKAKFKGTDKTEKDDSMTDKLEDIFAKEDFTKVQVVEAIKEFIPNFEHEEKGKNLDQKM